MLPFLNMLPYFNPSNTGLAFPISTLQHYKTSEKQSVFRSSPFLFQATIISKRQLKSIHKYTEDYYVRRYSPSMIKNTRLIELMTDDPTIFHLHVMHRRYVEQCLNDTSNMHNSKKVLNLSPALCHVTKRPTFFYLINETIDKYLCTSLKTRLE